MIGRRKKLDEAKVAEAAEQVHESKAPKAKETKKVCEHCNGRGLVSGEFCDDCQGHGFIKQ